METKDFEFNENDPLTGIDTGDKFSSSFFPAAPARKLSFYVFCGIPGTGKSTYAKILRTKYKYQNDNCKIISRDEIRKTLLWDLRKDEPVIQKRKLKKLDSLVSKKVFEEINACVEKNKYGGIVIDGCHTNWKIMNNLLNFLRNYEKTIVNVLIVGNHHSECMHKITNKEDDDFGEYYEEKPHVSIPLGTLARKRKEMKELVDHHLDNMKPFIDYIFLVPNRIWEESQK